MSLAFSHAPIETGPSLHHRPEQQLQRGIRLAVASRVAPRQLVRAAQASSMAQPAVSAPELRTYTDTRPSPAALRTALSTDISPEHIKEVECAVSGQVPAWLSGVLLRNGPGTFRGKRHLFDGYAMIVKFRIQGGAVHVSNRFVESNAWKAFRDSGEPAYAEFGTPLPSLLSSFKNILTQVTGVGQGITDNSNVNVIPLTDGKTAVSMTEAVAGTFTLDIETLATLAPVKYKDAVKGALTTAHPTVRADGSLINLTSDIGGGYTVYRSSAGSDVREVIAKLPLRSFPTPSWIHDFPCTANYAIIPETPVLFNVKALSVGGDCEYVVMDWRPELQTQLTLVPLNGDAAAIRRFTMPPYFAFHYVNAFESEDGSELSFDFGWMKDPGMLNNLRLAEMHAGQRPVLPAPLKRVTVPLDGRTEVRVTSLMKDDSAYVQAELPRVNPAFKGKPYRYAYSISAKPPCTADNALSKYDLDMGESKSWFEAGALPTEPLMVARPGATAEDDGVVLSVVTGADGRSFLLVLDAGTFQEVARAHLGFGVPYQFHGNWLSTA